MRNLVEHPVTSDEIVECLRTLSAEQMAQNVRDLRCGDMSPLLLSMAADIVEASWKLLVDMSYRLEHLEEPLRYTAPWGPAAELTRAFMAVKEQKDDHSK